MTNDYPEKYARLVDSIRNNENNATYTPTIDDQLYLAIYLYEKSVTEPNNTEWRKSEFPEAVRKTLDHDLSTVLENLSETDVVNLIEPRGSGTFIRSNRTGDLFYRPTDKFEELLGEEIRRFVADLSEETEGASAVADGGTARPTLRSVAADALDVDPFEVESEVQDFNDPVDRMENYDTAVQAIESEPDVQQRRDYQPLGWRNAALKYQLSSIGVALVEDADLRDFN